MTSRFIQHRRAAGCRIAAAGVLSLFAAGAAVSGGGVDSAARTAPV